MGSVESREGNGVTADAKAKPAQVCAIVVTYQPQLSAIDNVRRLRSQVAEVVVVDNGSNSESGVILQELEKIPGVRLLRNSRNLGIAAALNIGVRYAAEANFNWIATFDQDSTVTPELFESMLAAYETCPLKESVALVSPIHCVSEAEWKKKNKRGSRHVYKLMQAAITSGSLIKASVFTDVGWYDEPMFIDYVDFDHCLRLSQRDYKIIRSCRSFLLHRLGSLEAHSFLGIPVTIKSHNASRRYYSMRNRVTMYRRYGLMFPAWMAKDFGWLLLDFTKILVFERDKRAKLRYAFKGIRHGLAGVSGQLAQADS